MKTLLFVLCLMVPASLSAQTVINPNTLEWDVSLDHTAVDLAGNPKVTSYDYLAIAMNPIGAIAITVALPMPGPTATHIISPLPGLAQMVQDMIYTAQVNAVGPGGVGVSAPSNPFVNAAQLAPRPPLNVKVSKK